ncbi:bifunctional aspartate kinase/homoserine dehydrogenase II [Chromatiaceae bacterium AAb-1]|nr:bifunctional aspartate kinase/homoserine dehydrogenase II [Chromatiaceae bacterium AAb-1]
MPFQYKENSVATVHKFGGSSLGDASRFQAVAEIIRRQSDKALWVVVSAPGDTTDHLLEIIEHAAYPALRDKALQVLSENLTSLVSQSLTAENAGRVLATLQHWLAAIPDYLALQQYNDVLATGERLSALLLSAVLSEQSGGQGSVAVDARDFLVLAGNQVQWQESSAKLAALSASDSRNLIHVVTGYIARDDAGNSITLGRNGSDYSATILGRLLQADSVTIWTDVDAIYSSDPRRVPQALPYRQVSWQQAAALASLGNPVLHARTLSPLEQTDTTLQVRSSFYPEKAGCCVATRGDTQAEFITELPETVILHVPTTATISAEQLALQLQQPVIALTAGQEQQWLIKAKAAEEALALLAARHITASCNRQHYHAVAWIKPLQSKVLPEAAVRYLQQFEPEAAFDNAQQTLWLFRQQLTAEQVAALHSYCISAVPQLHVLVAGSGNVGGEFLNLLVTQQQKMAGQIKLNLSAVFNSRQACLQPDIPAVQWQQLLSQAPGYQYQTLLAYIQALPEPKVLVDITPSQAFALNYPEFIAAGCHIISANKQGVTLPGAQYQQIKQSQAKHRKQWLSNTTAGAGIPVQRVLQELLNSGDQIRQISGIFSGTLSWLLCRYDGSKPFSEFVLEAQQNGLTEPDPRDDLCGKDVQRKLLVLARELGLSLELEQIALQPLLPAGLEKGDWQTFWQAREQLDQALHTAYVSATAQGKVLRYSARLDVREAVVAAKVELVAVSVADPLAAIQPCDNIFVIESGWYQENPLVLKGPGAGRLVTAGGIHADLAVLAQRIIQSGYGPY